MTSKKRLCSLLSLCLSLLAVISLCGCEDLGAFEDVERYYASFGDIRLTGGTREGEAYPTATYSVEAYFYNTDSREDFLEGEDGYAGVPEGDYVYMAIPLEAQLCVDSLALYLKSPRSTTLCLSVFLVDELPEKIRGIGDPATELVEKDGVTEEQPIAYDDPPLSESLSNHTLSLQAGEWEAFLIDSFLEGGSVKKQFNASAGQYILILFRNNSDAFSHIDATGARFDPVTGAELFRESFTMTNLLVRAIDPTEGE